MRAARHASVLLASAALLALAACSDSEDSFSIVSSAQAQEAAGGSAGATPGTRMTDPSSATAPAAQGTVDVAALMAEGALPDVVFGNPDAPVTIVEYASMTCGHCANFHNNSLPAIKADYIDTGIAKLIVRESPFDQRALAAFMLARCIGPEKRQPMIDVLFKQQANWAQAENASVALLSIARLAGMSEADFRSCLSNTELQGQIAQVTEKGQSEFNVSGTPTFFINGERYVGAMSANEMAAIIETKR